MQRRIQVHRPGRQAASSVAVVLFDKSTTLPPGYAQIDEQAGGALGALIGRKEFAAGKGALVTLYPGTQIERLYVLGLGEREAFRSDNLRIAGVQLAKATAAAQVDRVAIDLPGGLEDSFDHEQAGRALGDGLALGSFTFNQFKGTATTNGNGADKQPGPLRVEAKGAVAEGLKHSLQLGESVGIARELAATPPNVANPGYLVSYCRKLARKVGLKCTIVDARKAEQLNMGGLLAVGRAGSTPPALICLEWEGGKAGRPRRGAGKTAGRTRQADQASPLLLVGKAITFDTGGYSIKPAQGMESMKYDKCGGMAVIGAMHAAATLNLPQRVVGLIATAENMVDSSAYRPSDIITLCNGVTVEVTNTDAEGRLVLADALAYGTRTYKPRAVVDLATLTGGVIVALGHTAAGCFCNDEDFRGRLMQAGEQAGERLWHLPLWPEHREQLKSAHADMVNSAGRDAHPIQGAAFLSYFIEPQGRTSLPELPWAHLDIAGTANLKQDTPLYAAGPTGFGVRLLARLMEQGVG